MANVTSDDYYEVLGVSRRASAGEIKKAYRKLALKWHPDRHTGADATRATELFKNVGEAYNILSNPQERAAYDRFGKGGLEGAFGGAGGGMGGDPFDIFSAFFGGANQGFGDAAAAEGVDLFGGSAAPISYDGGKTHLVTKADGRTYVTWKRPLNWIEKRRRAKLKAAREKLGAAAQSGGGGGSSSSPFGAEEEEEEDFVVVEKLTKHAAARHLFGITGQVIAAAKQAKREENQRMKEEKKIRKSEAKERRRRESSDLKAAKRISKVEASELKEAMRLSKLEAKKKAQWEKNLLKKRSESELSGMRVKELKQLLKARDIEHSHCVEKRELIALIISNGGNTK